MLKEMMTYDELLNYCASEGVDFLRYDWGFVVWDWKLKNRYNYRRDGDAYRLISKNSDRIDYGPNDIGLRAPCDGYFVA